MDALIVKPYNSKSLRWIGVGLFFVAFFDYVLVTSKGEEYVHMAQGMMLLFGIPTLVFVTFLLPGSSVVKADREGIECRMLWIRAFRLEWSDIEAIVALDFPSTRGILNIGFTCISLSEVGRKKMRRSFFHRMTNGKLGTDKSIPDLFGSPKELARVLNERRVRFGRGATDGRADQRSNQP